MLLPRLVSAAAVEAFAKELGYLFTLFVFRRLLSDRCVTVAQATSDDTKALQQSFTLSELDHS